MNDMQRYRSNAADCLLAAGRTENLSWKRMNLLLAQAWLDLATKDDAVDHMLAGWGMPKADALRSAA
jgi:hypothetical protein